MSGRTQGALGLVALAIAGISWGTAGTLGTLLGYFADIGVVAIAGYRIAVGGLLIGVVVLLTRQFRPPRTRAGWIRVLAIAACSVVYQLGFFGSISLVGVSIATLIAIGAAPVMVLIVDAATGRHRVSWHVLVTVALAILGLALLVGSPPGGLAPERVVYGTLLALLASAGFAGISLMAARPEPDYHDLTGTMLALTLGGAGLLVAALFFGGIGFYPEPITIGLVIALGLIPTAIGYLAYFFGLRSHSSTTGVLVALLEPVTAVVLAWVILADRLTGLALLGAGLLVAAVVLTALMSTPAARGRPLG